MGEGEGRACGLPEPWVRGLSEGLAAEPAGGTRGRGSTMRHWPAPAISDPDPSPCRQLQERIAREGWSAGTIHRGSQRPSWSCSCHTVPMASFL